MKTTRSTLSALNADEPGAPVASRIAPLRRSLPHWPQMGQGQRSWPHPAPSLRRAGWLGLAWLLGAGFALQASAPLRPLSTWSGGGGDNRWDNPANWDPSGVPDAHGIATINSGSPDATGVGAASVYQVNLNGGTLTSAGLAMQILNQAGGALAGSNYLAAGGGVWNWSYGWVYGWVGIAAGGQANWIWAMISSLAMGWKFRITPRSPGAMVG